MSKAILITGAGARVGRHFAQNLAADGWTIAIHYNRSQKAVEQLCEDIQQAGGKAAPIQANLSNQQALDSLIAHSCEALESPLHALINNASTFKDDRAETFTHDQFDFHMNVNLRAPLRLAQKFAQQCPANTEGCIINMIDNRVHKPNPLFFTYTLSKAALYWATKTLAQALAPHIRVNGIGPGPTLQNTGQTHADFVREARTTLLGKSSPPEALLQACRFLLEADNVTGQMLCVDSGQHLTWQTEDLLAGGVKHAP